MPSHKSNDYKLTAVQYYLVEDNTQEEVCKIFKCSPRSLMRWVERYKNEGNVNIHYRKPVAYKVKKEYVKLLVDEINKNKTITLQEVFKKYTGIFAISVNGVIHWDLYEKGGINTDRLIDFLEYNITNKLRNKLIILDNASAHRNERIKELVNKHNNILYAVPYQHFTNSIENYFSMLKSRLQKLDGLKYENLKENIQKVISEIPKEKYENIFKGAYERPEKYVPKNKTRKVKKIYK